MDVRIYVSRKAEDCKRLLDRIDLKGEGYGLETLSNFQGLAARLSSPLPDHSLFVVCPGDRSELTALAGLQAEVHPKPMILILDRDLDGDLDQAYRCRPRIVFNSGDGPSAVRDVLLRMIGQRLDPGRVRETVNG